MKLADAISYLGSRVVDPASWEKDADFSDLLSVICRRGLLAAGVLAILGLSAYLITGLGLLGKDPVVWTKGPDLDKDLMVLWDKIVVLFAGALLLIIQRSGASLRWGRLAAGLLVVILSAISVFDEVTGARDISTGAVYPTLYLLVAAGAIPYRPLQMLSLAAVTYGTVLVAEAWFPSLLGVTVIGSRIGQLPYIFIAISVVTGLTVLLYSTRYDQFVARREAERLAAKLEEHARQLGEAKAETERQSAKLVEAEHLKDRFFGNISHEFRTPLTLIMGPVEDALEGAHGRIEASMEAMLGGVQRNAKRLLGLVNDLLDLSRLDAEKVRLHIEEHDLVEFLNTVFHHFADTAARRKISLSYKSQVDRLDVSFDPGALEKVVYNLLSNAFKFVPDEGSVMLRLEIVGGRARITVKDNGAGIPPEELAMIWDRFHRIEVEGSSEGTGIGLALVKELVELHGGDVGVRSDVGFGSEFLVSLPIDKSGQIPDSVAGLFEVPAIERVDFSDDAPEEDGRPEEIRHAPIVLVVDNDAEIRKYVRKHLATLYRIREAEDGVEALAAIREERPSLVISDVMMPRMDGIELCRKIKGDPDLADLPVVMLTARAGIEDELEGLQAGADDYIPKPFSSAALATRVENLIELRRLLHRRFTDGVVEPSPIEVPSVSQTFMERVRTAVEEHMSDSQFGVDWLADEVGLSSRQLQRRIRDITRLSAAGYIRAMRLKRAAQLIEQEAGNVSEVAYAVGFRDAAYFSRLFKKVVGVVPSEYAVRSVPTDDEEPEDDA